MVLSWLAERVSGWVMAALRRGDVRPALLLDAPDVVLTFPGENSFAGVFRGKSAHREWEKRFCRIGFQIFPDEVVAVGPPWRTTVCVRGRDHCRSPEGELLYENRYVIWGHLRWGRMKDLEVYEDTEKTAHFDRWLAEHETDPATAPTVRSGRQR
jgi:ketosteroid isomerase-like protein